MRVLVTGAGGYVGSGLVETLSAAGWQVRALVRHPAPHLNVEQVVTDLDGYSDAITQSLEGVDTVVHLAGENEVMAARDPGRSLASTVLATERVVEEAPAAGVKRVVYLSTVHVYGERMVEGAVLTEDLRPEPRASYAIARLASEHVVASLAKSDVDGIVLRLTNAVGAPADLAVDRWTLVANDLCRQGATVGSLTLHSSGVQWRDFIALRDVHEMIAAACRWEEPTVVPGTYNVGSGTPTTIRQLAELVQDAFERATGERPELHAPEPGPDRPRPYEVSVDRLHACGLRAPTPLEEAVDETARFCLDNKEALSEWARSTT